MPPVLPHHLKTQRVPVGEDLTSDLARNAILNLKGMEVHAGNPRGLAFIVIVGDEGAGGSFWGHENGGRTGSREGWREKQREEGGVTAKRERSKAESMRKGALVREL